MSDFPVDPDTEEQKRKEEEMLLKEEARLTKSLGRAASLNSAASALNSSAPANNSTESPASQLSPEETPKLRNLSISRRPAWSTVSVRRIPTSESPVSPPSGPVSPPPSGSALVRSPSGSSGGNSASSDGKTSLTSSGRSLSSLSSNQSDGKKASLSVVGRSQSALTRVNQEKKLVTFTVNGEPHGQASFDLDVKEGERSIVVNVIPTVRQETVTVFITGAFLRFEALHLESRKEGGATIKETITLSQELELPFTPNFDQLLFRPTNDGKQIYLEVIRPW